MTALSAGRKLQTRDNRYASYPVAANVKFYPGARVSIDTSGYVRPARTSATDKANGYVEQAYDNTGGSAAAFMVRVTFGCANFANSTSGDLITYADVGSDCYVVDDQTVAKTSNSSARISGGKIIDVDAAGVWVNCGPGR